MFTTLGLLRRPRNACSGNQRKPPDSERFCSQIWWWQLLATNDPGITLSNGVIYGVGGSITVCATVQIGDNNTTPSGQAYLYAKMNVRQATAAEVLWASQGSSTNIINKWTPILSVAGRPAAVNEYGF